ncbi:MAG: beta-ketoacyl-[acyl-carrier-protein] synthase family protein, partial [Planctomycetia bacterium]
PNMPACHISIIFDAQGPNNSITAGEASSALAMGEAYRVMKRGVSDVFLAGGSDSKIHPLSFVRLLLLNRATKRNDDPEHASRPFDAGRDGLVPGEGSGFLVLETLDHAQARGATIHGEVIGFGASCVPGDDRAALRKGMERALKDAGITPADLGHVVANGLSLVHEDHQEVLALHDVLGDAAATVPVVAYKGYIGHVAAGAGAVEAVATLLCKHHGQLVPSLNFEKFDADLPPIRLLTEAIDFPNKPWLMYSLSHAGQCGALVMRPFND